MPKYDSSIPFEQISQIRDGEVLELLKQEKTTEFALGTKWNYHNSGHVISSCFGRRIGNSSCTAPGRVGVAPARDRSVKKGTGLSRRSRCPYTLRPDKSRLRGC